MTCIFEKKIFDQLWRQWNCGIILSSWGRDYEDDGEES